MTTYGGIEIGGTKLQLVLGQPGKILKRRKLMVDTARGAEGIRKQIQFALDDLTAREKPASLGVGFGGPVDWQSGKICRSHQIEGWSEFDLSRWLRQIIDVPVVVENDANVAALGEARHGTGKKFSHVFYVTLGSGVGGGMVVDGAIYHGTTPGEAEIGHIRLDRDGAKVESHCSGWALDRALRQLAESEPKGAVARLIGNSKGGEAKFLGAALEAGDASAQKVLQSMVEDLAFGLSHVVHLFHPQIIILGGGISGIGEPLRRGVEIALRKYVMEAFVPGLHVALASLGEDTVPMGALDLASQALL